MRLHRFYIPDTLSDAERVTDQDVLHQWTNVFRMKEGDHVILFDPHRSEKEYRVRALARDHADLEYVATLDAKVPPRSVTLLFSLLKKEKNEWVLQKCTEIGVTSFVPLVTDRTEKTGFPLERMQKIIVEAAEQCGRADIPSLAAPTTLAAALSEWDARHLYVCDQRFSPGAVEHSDTAGYLIGPEGGWSEKELTLLTTHGATGLSLGDFTLRAETAAVIGAREFLRAHRAIMDA